ncbi:MAG: hypothetical protein V2I62_08475 [Bacteroidales bacterium]|jgi:hypothetical protein|nr:hypothetical protein [Bacteroidales bacterium]
MIYYVIIFGLLITGVIIWQLRSNTRYLRLSHQLYPEIILDVLISKKERKVDEFIIRIHAKHDVSLRQLKIELITAKREFEYIASDEIEGFLSFPSIVERSNTFDTICPYEELKNLITSKMPHLSSFRVVLELQNNKVYKSHELKFDKFWKIYRSDTGRYN